MFFSYKKQIVWNAAWLLWCVGFGIFDLIAGHLFFGVFMFLLAGLFTYLLVGAVQRRAEARRTAAVAASYHRIDNEWRK